MNRDKAKKGAKIFIHEKILNSWIFITASRKP